MKNLPNQIKSDLRQLRAIKPDAAWLEQNKQALLADLPMMKSPERTLSYVSVFSISFKQAVSKLAWQPVGISLMILGIIGGPSLAAVNAAKGSLPGDALYPVKRSLERARVSMTFSQTKKAQLEVDFVATRLHELQRLTKEQAPSEKRQQKITIAIEELKKDTAAVKTRLDAAKQDTGNTGKEAVALAKIIDDKTSGYQATLQQTIDELGEEAASSTSSTLTEAVTTVQEVSINALDVLVDKAGEAESQVSKEDLKARVENHLEVVKKSANSLQNQVRALDEVIVPPAPETKEPSEADDTADQADDENPAPEEETVSAEPAPVEQPAPVAPVTREELQKRLDTEVFPFIKYSEELIKLRDFATALETLNKANKKVEEISTLLRSLLPKAEEPKKVEPQPVEETPAAEETKDDASATEEQAEAKPAEGAPDEQAPEKESTDNQEQTSEQPADNATAPSTSQ